jgi:hypothetical protein
MRGIGQTCGICGLVLLGLLGVGCASRTAAPSAPAVVAPPVVVAPAEVVPQRSAVKLVWMPLDPQLYAKLGQAINDRLENTVFPGVDSRAKAPVSMEDAQLSLECSEATVKCYAAVGRHVQANRLFWAELKRDRRKKAVTVALSLLDVDQEVMANRAQRTFNNPKSALAGLDALVQEVMAPAGRAAP